MSKILIDEAALEQALEMLNDNREYIEANERPAYLAIYDKAIADAEKALAEAEKQQALDKMADNARELGLSYEQPAPAQEPTKAMIDAAERIDWSDSDVRGNIVNMWQAMLAAAPQPAREPLTDEQAVKIVRWSIHNLSLTCDGPLTPEDIGMWVLRFVEAAHGITKGNT